MRILSVDPGFSGAWALVVDGRAMLCGDMPVAGEGSRKRVNAASLAETIRTRLPDLVVVEGVNAFPGQGVSSSFRFGVSFGVVLGVTGALGLPLELVAPASWKRHHRLIGTEKEASRAKAIDLAPHLTSMLDRHRDHGRADAILIGLYGHATFSSGTVEIDAPSPANVAAGGLDAGRGRDALTLGGSRSDS